MNKTLKISAVMMAVVGLVALGPVGMLAGADGTATAQGYVRASSKTDQLSATYTVAEHDLSDAASQIAGRGASGMFQWHKQVVPAFNAGNDDELGYASCGSSCGKRAVLGTKTASDVIPACTDTNRWVVTNDCDTLDEAATPWGLYAASESPFSAGDYATAASRNLELVTFPMSIAIINVVFNINSCADHELKLTGALISRMYRPVSGDGNGPGITMWNDPALVALNPCLAGEATPIVRVIRCDGSGTTFAFSDYLKRSSGQSVWGPGDLISTPAENEICGAQNPGVSAAVGANYGAFGYVEKQQSDLDGRKDAQIQAKDGAFLVSSEQGGIDAATATAPTLPKSHESWASVSIAYAPGATSWPISTFGYLLATSTPYQASGANGAGGAVVNYRDLWTPEQYNALKEFFAYANLNARAESLVSIAGYAPVGDAVADINAAGIDRMNYGEHKAYTLGNENTDVVALAGYATVGQIVSVESSGVFTPTQDRYTASGAGALVAVSEPEGSFVCVSGDVTLLGAAVLVDAVPAGRLALGAVGLAGVVQGATQACGQVVDNQFLVHKVA